MIDFVLNVVGAFVLAAVCALVAVVLIFVIPRHNNFGQKQAAAMLSLYLAPVVGVIVFVALMVWG